MAVVRRGRMPTNPLGKAIARLDELPDPEANAKTGT
jgi:hypothetical protein